MKNIFVVAAHPDDEILGVGGTIAKLSKQGHNVNCLILGEGLTSRKTNRTETAKDHIESLKTDAQEATKTVGYHHLYFGDLPDNRFDSMDLLDVTKVVEKYIEMLKPDTVFTHHYGDLNLDHRITFNAVLTACRPVGNYVVEELFAFETPSSTEWNFKYGDASFKPNVFFDIEETIELKLKAMICYKTEIRDYPHPRSLKALETIASRWGTVVGKQYVEAFELIRKVY